LVKKIRYHWIYVFSNQRVSLVGNFFKRIFFIKMKQKNKKQNEFIVVNQFAQVFCGLRGGYPQFDNNWEIAKPLSNLEQFNNVQRGTIDKLEILYL
jgi:hypothetical protein